MVKRKHKRRLRQKTKFQKTFRENAGSKNRDEESDASVQRSPEAVLYESPHRDLLCNEKLSPEIIPKRSRIRLLRAKAYEDDAEVEDEIAARNIELSNSSLLKRHESKCNYKHDIKSTSDFPHLEDYPKRDIGGSVVGETFDSANCYSFRSLFLKKEQSSDKSADDAPKNISQLPTFYSDLESRLRNNIYIFTGDVSAHANSDRKNGGRSFEKRSQQEDRCKPETIKSFYSLDKALSINNDLICQNNYLEKQPSAIIASHFTVKKSSSIADLQSESLDRFILARSSLCESVERNDGLRDKADKSRKRRSDNNERFDAETFGERVTNWHELGKIFSYLWRITKKLRGQDTERGASFITKYKKFIDDRWRSCTSTTTLSSVSTFLAPSPLPSDANNDGNPITYRSLLAKEDRESKESDLETENIEYFGIQSGSTTPCSGSPPPAKRCRTTLTFEDETVEEQRQPANRAEITDPFFKKGRKSEERSFPLNLPSCEETPHWNIPKSTFLPDVDPSAVPDYDNCENAQQQKRYQDDAYKQGMSRSTATTRNSRDRRNVPRAIITWMIALCMWLKRKLLHLLNSAYRKVQMINSFLTKKSPRTKNLSEEERINYLVTTLHFENEKTLCALSVKMTRLSTDLVQIRTSIETEMNVLREANKKIVENNATMMQELKKLHEILEKMQSKSPQSIPLSSSFPSYPPPPPPPPLPLSVPPSSLTFPLKTQDSKLTMYGSPPCLQPLSSASVQSTMSLTQPTTPNSSKSNKISTPTRKCFTPSSNRPRITVEDLLKVTLRKAPQSAKENRRNSIQGPAVSLEMLRNVKLKSTKRRSCDQTGRSPRSRIMKNRTASNINLSPILTGSEQNLERILRQVKLTRPRRLIIESSSFQDDFVKETQSLETLTHS
ncbi:uncharacterized protein [Linepithema humile]|uniref:uncharacterized protein n=1 Tax=Linepithema humile TaxID=83485 RepID=UPI000623593B|nr:PREDICTED: uncharacterized protein LOC105679076 [Linepithema humile]